MTSSVMISPLEIIAGRHEADMTEWLFGMITVASCDPKDAAVIAIRYSMGRISSLSKMNKKLQPRLKEKKDSARSSFAAF